MTVKQKSLDNYIITDVVAGRYCEMEYLYYSKKESISLFKEKFAELYELEGEYDGD